VCVKFCNGLLGWSAIARYIEFTRARVLFFEHISFLLPSAPLMAVT
jgi:hypothetical protein